DRRGLAGAERSSRARGSWVASAGSRSRLLKHLEPSHGHVPHRSQQAVRDVRGFGPLGVFAFGGQPDALRHALALAEVLVNQLVSAVDGVVGRLAWTIGRARRLRSGVLRSGLGRRFGGLRTFGPPRPAWLGAVGMRAGAPMGG